MRRPRHHVPPPGQEATVILGPHDRPHRVTVLGTVRQYVVGRTANGQALIVQRLVEVHVHGEKRPWDLAVERFVAPVEAVA